MLNLGGWNRKKNKQYIVILCNKNVSVNGMLDKDVSE